MQAIYAFIGPHIETVRKQLVEANREFKATEESKRLRDEATKIERIINSDFDSFRRKLQKVRAASAGAGFDVSEEEAGSSGTGEDDFLYGGDEPATITFEAGELGKTKEGPGPKNGGPPRRLNPVVEPDTEGTAKGHSESTAGEKPRRRGGFTIEFNRKRLYD